MSLSKESLFSFGIKDLQTALRREGFSIQKVEEVLSRGGAVEVRHNYTRTNRRGEVESLSFEVVFGMDSEGLCLSVRSGGRLLGESYSLVRKESNLKTGTYRYYIRDPHPLPGREALCEKLYYLPGLCEFVSIPYLRSCGVLYSQQMRGKKERYINPRPLPPTKHRKTHYRGKTTPFWEKYQRDTEEREVRIFLYFLDFFSGRVPPEIEMAREDYFRRIGRKTTPRKRPGR